MELRGPSVASTKASGTGRASTISMIRQFLYTVEGCAVTTPCDALLQTGASTRYSLMVRQRSASFRCANVAEVASLVITMSMPEGPLFEDFTYIAANS